MKTLLQRNDLDEITSRVEKLRPDSPALWGKMNVAQMMRHCTIAAEYACGDHPARHMFIGKIFGRPFRAAFYNDKPFGKNLPTSPKFVVVDERIFEKEMQILLKTLKRFTDDGAASVTEYPHQWYGQLTADQWGVGMYKHLDHHLRQFGV